ncbi:MAG: transporter substrate-binding domain-containing protein [Myxococcota bacterium]
MPWGWMLAIGLGFAQEVPESSELSVAVSPFSPFVQLDAGAAPKGFSIDLFEAVAREEGLQFRYVPYANVSEKLAAVASGQADLAIGGISVTLQREREVDFTLPTFRTGLDILVRSESASVLSWAVLERVLTPARMGIVLGFLLLIVVSGHLVWWAERGKEAFDDRYVPGVFEGMYWAIVTASTVGYGDKAPVRWAGRLVAALVIIVSLPMFAVFTAELTSTLTVANLESGIQNADDLRGRRVGVVKGTTGERATMALGAVVVPFSDASAAKAALVTNKVEAVVHDAPNLAELATRLVDDDQVNVHLLGDLFEPQRYGMAVPQGGDRREVLNRGLLSVQESGEWEAIRRQWFEGDLGR